MLQKRKWFSIFNKIQDQGINIKKGIYLYTKKYVWKFIFLESSKFIKKIIVKAIVSLLIQT